MSYVYIIAADPKGPCKIGFSIKPATRSKQLQTGSLGQRLTVFAEKEFGPERAPKVEKILHQTLNHLHLYLEWYNITVEDAVAELELAMIHYGDDCNLTDHLWETK